MKQLLSPVRVLTAALLAGVLSACGTSAPAEPNAAEAQPVTAQSSTNYRVRVILESVYCANTEDVTGGDEFYAAGNVVVGTPDGKKKAVPFITTPPVSLNDGNTMPYQLAVFNEVVPAGTFVDGRLIAYDEDSAKTWSEVGPGFIDAGNAAAQTLIQSGNSTATIAAGALSAGIKILDASMKADKDDVLGQTGIAGVNVTGTATIARSVNFKKSSFLGWSSWNYTIKYRIEVTPTTSLVTLR